MAGCITSKSSSSPVFDLVCPLSVHGVEILLGFVLEAHQEFSSEFGAGVVRQRQGFLSKIVLMNGHEDRVAAAYDGVSSLTSVGSRSLVINPIRSPSGLAVVRRPTTGNASGCSKSLTQRSEGLQGWDFRQYPWFADALTVRREGATLIMELDHWEPIGNLSTSNGSGVFYTSLLATAFSDPTVEKFDLSIRGENCPVYIGDSEMCFPIMWDDLIRMNPSS